MTGSTLQENGAGYGGWVGLCMMVVIGSGLLMLAIAAATVGVRAGRLWQAIRQAGVTTPDALVEVARASRTTGITARRLCGVVGVATLPTGQTRLSTVNKERCVWHRHVVVHRQVRQRTDASGRIRRSTRRRRVENFRSNDPFLLVGQAAQVEIWPDRMRVYRPDRGRTRILPGRARQSFPDDGVILGDGGVQHFFRHDEWVVREGTQLYVLGDVIMSRGEVTLRRPAKGPHILSTRAGAQLQSRALVVLVLVMVVAIVAAVTGTILVVDGLR